MVIKNNMSALFSSRQVNVNEASMQKSMEKLSSGEKINRAGDDAAGLAVSEGMRARIRGLSQASKNIGDGISFIQTSEGFLQETNDILQRIRELAVQSSNGIYSDEDRAMISVEVSSLVAEVDRIASQASFNGLNMLTGRFANDETGSVMQIHVGAETDQNIRIYIGDMTASGLGLRDPQVEGNTVSVADPESANKTISTIDEALKTVNRQRADLGAYQNRFEIAKKGIDIAAENLISSESRIRDTDFAEEMVNFSKDQILTQASQAMLAQANVSNQNVLSLLR